MRAKVTKSRIPPPERDDVVLEEGDILNSLASVGSGEKGGEKEEAAETFLGSARGGDASGKEVCMGSRSTFSVGKGGTRGRAMTGSGTPGDVKHRDRVGVTGVSSIPTEGGGRRDKGAMERIEDDGFISVWKLDGAKPPKEWELRAGKKGFGLYRDSKISLHTFSQENPSEGDEMEKEKKDEGFFIESDGGWDDQDAEQADGDGRYVSEEEMKEIAASLGY